MRDATGNVQSIVVYGGTSEIGQAIVETFATAKLRSVVLACRQPEAAAKVLARWKARSIDVRVEPFEVTQPGTHPDLVNRILGAVGDIDLAVLAVGQLGAPDVAASPVAAADLMAANLAGPTAVLLATAEAMRRQGHGTIVVLSSVAGERVRRSNYVYGASKAGLDALAQGLAADLAGSGVRVLVVRPGFVTTRMTAGMRPAPMATTPTKVAASVRRAVEGTAEVIWTPAVLRPVFMVLRHLPTPLFRRLPL